MPLKIGTKFKYISDTTKPAKTDPPRYPQSEIDIVKGQPEGNKWIKAEYFNNGDLEGDPGEEYTIYISLDSSDNFDRSKKVVAPQPPFGNSDTYGMRSQE